MEKHNIKIEVNVKVPCPKCEKGHLLPFLKEITIGGSLYGRGLDAKFDHYEVYYRCSNCNYGLEGNSLITESGAVY
jgi:hypothetical protein